MCVRVYQPSSVKSRDVRTAEEHLCPPKFRVLNTPKWLARTLEWGVKTREQEQPASETTEVNWFKWKQAIKNRLLKDSLGENLGLLVFLKKYYQ